MLKIQVTPFEETFELNEDDVVIQNLKKRMGKHSEKEKTYKDTRFLLVKSNLVESFLARVVSLTMIIGKDIPRLIWKYNLFSI